MNYGLLNLGSIILGLIAWALPILSISQYKKGNCNFGMAFTLIGLLSALLSLLFQIIYQNNLVKIEDWSALMDTSNAVVIVSALFVCITLAINIFSFTTTIIINSKKKGVPPNI